MKIRIKLLTSLLIFIFILLSGCIEIPAISICGNGIIEEGETSENCCIDVGCHEGQNCENNTCKDSLSRPLDILACTSIIAEVLEFHDSPEIGVLMVTVLVNEVNEYIPLWSSEILLNKGDEITIYFSRIGMEPLSIEKNLSIGAIIDINIRCIDGEVSDRDSLTQKACYWSDVDDIKSTHLCPKNSGPIINDLLIPPDYEQAKGSLR